jgi:16S rRNA (guanine527-N7)-methyltransferase
MTEATLYSPADLISKYLAPEELDAYFSALMDENQRVNLVSRETTRAGFEKLVAESLLPLEFVGTAFRELLDVGSGGGIPAIPLLLALSNLKRAVFVERTLKKARALRGIIQNLGLSARVVDRNYEEHHSNRRPDLITMRLVKLDRRLLERAVSDLAPGGKIVYWSTPQFDCRKHDIVIHNFRSPEDEVTKSLTVISR